MISQIRRLVLILLAANLIHSVQANDVFTPRIAALGGSGHAAPMLSDSIFQNPSHTSFLNAYCASFTYDRFLGSNEVHQGRNYTISMIDGRTELFQAGAAYTIKEEGRLVHIGLSKAPTQIWSLGTTMKILMPNDQTIGTTYDFNASTTLKPVAIIQASFGVDNVIENENSKRLGYFREFILGTRLAIENMLFFYFDPHYTPSVTDGTNWGFEMGVEMPVMKDVFLRGGYFKNSLIPHMANGRGGGWSLGLGWSAPKISLDYAFHRVIDMNNGLTMTTAHVFGASIYF